jgi:CubicO group peptidase (beta-lactamase class C family)
MRTLPTAIVVLAIFASPAPRLVADHAAEIDRLVKPLIEAHAIVGCVVGLVDDDRREIQGYGEIKRGEHRTPDGTTIYEIGSVTKAFTGTLLADMVERGEVRLDQPIAELLPEGASALRFTPDRPITLLHLATHTSGLPRLPDNMAPKDPKNSYADYTHDLMYAFLSQHQLRRAPGQFEYSNYGVGLLGALLARRAGLTYEELFIERIANPLDMTDSRIRLSDEQTARFAPPYDGGLLLDHVWDGDALNGAGGVRSTADDMLKFLAAAVSKDDDRVGRAIRAAWERRIGDPGVGLCWMFAGDRVSRWHNGQTGGYSAFIGVHPPERKAVVVLCNTSTELTTLLGEKILQAMLGLTPEPIALREEAAVDVAVLEAYVGNYELAPDFVITVTFENGRLMVQATGQSKNPIFAESPTEFFLKAVDAQITFEVDGEGNVKGLILHQNGDDKPAMRIPEAANQ